MGSIKRSGFVEPYPQTALGGEPGLTAADIAESLGVEAKAIRKKIRRDKYAKLPEFKAVPYGTLNDINGLEYTEYVFSVRAAKAFVARWASQTGDGYLNYLFDCEQIAEKQVPIMQSVIDAFRRKLTRKRQSYIRVPRIHMMVDIFGTPYAEVSFDKVPIEDADDATIAAWKFQHRQATLDGLSRAQLDDLKKGKIIPLADYKKLPPSPKN
jgi:hypothetical protein